MDARMSTYSVKRRAFKAWCVSSVLLGTVLGGPSAHADGSEGEKSDAQGEDKAGDGEMNIVDRCILAHEQAQSLRGSGQLRQAMDALLECAQDSCPAVISKECIGLVSEVKTQTPSVVFRASANGKPVTAVKVYVGDELLAEGLDGKAVPVDPGAQQFRFEAVGFDSVETEVLMAEGEHFRAVDVSFTDAPAGEAKAGGNGTEDAAPASTSRPVPVMTYALGGVSLLAFGSFAYFGLASQSERKKLEDTCAPNCSPDKADKVDQLGLIADVSLAVGAATAIGAVVFYLTRPEEPAEPDMAFGITPLDGGASASAAFRF
jgi:hypothetical protein